ncbi:MAG: HAD family hydrolase [Pseudomonadales bacterium]|jgi:putative phosphoserine phosphatase/1-acylglycerol-3-phosphate O-acyltransferase
MTRSRARSKQVTDFRRYLSELTEDGRAPADRPVVAYFDLDRTLIGGYSITALALTKMWSGSLSPKKIFVHAGIFLHWGLGRSDYHQLLESTVGGLVGMSEAEMAELGELAFERRIRPIIYLEGRQLIDAHKALGHEVVIVTSASRYQVDPIARELGVDQYYCTELEIEHGLITGNVTPCYGPGKKKAADVHAAFRSADLQDAFFYTDSCEDLPLLEEVGRPVAVNAKTSLARVASERGWLQLAFEVQGRAQPATRAA